MKIYQGLGTILFDLFDFYIWAVCLFYVEFLTPPVPYRFRIIEFFFSWILALNLTCKHFLLICTDITSKYNNNMKLTPTIWVRKNIIKICTLSANNNYYDMNWYPLGTLNGLVWPAMRCILTIPIICSSAGRYSRLRTSLRFAREFVARCYATGHYAIFILYRDGSRTK